MLLAGLLLLVGSMVVAQDRPLVSLQELLGALDEGARVAEATADLRAKLAEGMAIGDFVSGIAPLQRQCEPIIVLIARTEPPRELQQLGMNTAMGVKGVELAIWHYLYGAASGETDHVEYGDQLLTRARRELQRASELSAALR